MAGLSDSLDNTFASVQNILQGFAQERDRFYSIFGQAFGSDFNITLAETIRSQWASGDFSQIPTIQILDSGMNGALGAYAASTNTIYLSEGFLALATPEQLTAVILEEIGHYVDAQVNTTDTPGDEGEYFSRLVLGQSLSVAELTRIKTEDDTAIISVNGVSIQVEQASQSIGTKLSWNGSSSIGYFGEGATPTFGQTFTVPSVSNPTLNNFTIYINDFLNSDVIDFGFYVMAWDGSKATGPILYQSGVRSTTGFAGMEALVFDTNRLSLNPGQQYIAFVNASNFFDGQTGYGDVGFLGDYYGGGSFWYQGGNFSSLTSSPWGNYGGDLAFQAEFSSNTASPTLASISPGTLTDTATYNTFSNITGTLSGNDVDTDTTLTYGISGGTGGVTLVQNLVVDSQKNVASVGQPRVFSAPLTAGVQYKVVVSGTWRPDYSRPNWEADARYVSNNAWSSAQDFDPNGYGDLGLYSSALGNSDDIWGAYNSSHIYSTLVTGTGSAIDFFVQDVNYGDNLGVYQVAIYQIQTVTKAGTYGNLTLNPLNGQYTYTPNNSAINALISNATDDFTLTVSDGRSSASRPFTVNITGANDIASISGISTANLTEDANDPTLTASSNLSVSDVDSGQNKFNTTVSSSGNLGTLTITDTGTWNYSVANSAVQYLGATQTKTETFTVQSFDGTASQNVTITINGVNDTPTDLVLNTSSINENVAANSIVGSFTSTDPDSSNTFSYSLVTGTGSTDNASFSIVNGNQLSINTSPDYETKSSYSVRVRTTDQGGLTYEKALTIGVNNLNEAPTDLSLSATTINENVATNIVVGNFSSTDPDTGNTFTYSLVSGTGSTDNASFSIINGNQLSINASPDYETKSSYSVRIRTTDQGGLSYEKALTINVNNLNEAPTITSGASINFAENGTGTVYTVTGTDPDAGNTLSYSISGTDSALFNVNSSTGAVTFKTAPNFEAPTDNGANNVYDINVIASDGSLSDTKAVAISVTNVNEAPTAAALTNTLTTLAENSAINTGIKVADISITDDALGTETLSLTGTDASSFEIRGTQLFYIGASPNFEVKSSYTVNVIVDDTTVGSTPDFTLPFTLNITDVNEAPTAAALTNTSPTLAENSVISTGIKVADISITDDALGTNSLSLTGDDASSFEIRGTELFYIGASPNFEVKSSYTVNVVVDDTTVGSTPDFNLPFTLNITDVNEAPTAAALTNTSPTLAENSAINTGIKVADISINDDALGTETLSLTGTDASSFEIRGTQLFYIGASPNFEVKPSYSVNVVIDDTTVGSTPDFTLPFTLNITDVNEAPTAAALTNTLTTLAENSAINTGIKVADISTNDDALGTETLSLTGTDASSFEIRGTELFYIGASPNFEVKPSYSVNVVIDDTTVGSTPDFTLPFTLNITDVNEAPSVTSGTTSNFAENGTGTVYTVTGTDPDAGTTLTYSIDGTDSALFDINSSTGAVTFKTSPNFEAPLDIGANNIYNIIVIASDTGSLFDTKAVAISVTDINEAPTAVELINNLTLTLAGNSAINTGIKVADISITDDALGTNLLSLTGTDASSFEIRGTELFYIGTTVKSSYTINVVVDDTTVGNTPDLTLVLSGIVGGAGNDILTGTSGNDIIDGGLGTDTVKESADVNFILTNTSLTGLGTDTLISIESANLTGGIGNNILNASTFTLGSVTLNGGTGDDTLIGGNSTDTLTGGLDNDSLNGGDGTDTVKESGDVNFTLTNTTLTGLGSDTLFSIESANLTGGIGDNTLDASAFTLGSVTLNGGAGNDTLTGGTGNNTLIGGSGIDTVKESGNVNFTLTNTSLTGLGTDTLNTIESANLTGGIGDNTLDASAFTLGSVFLDGGSGDDVLTGGTKNDTLIGGNGDDTLTGGLGNDVLNGGNNTDTVKESGNVNFTLTNTSLTGLGTDTLISIESANLTGGIGNNTLNASTFIGAVILDGGGGNDILTGGTGDDTLIGGIGNDTLTGGLGNDSLNGGDGTDTVKESGDVNFTLTNTTLTGLGSDTLISIESANLTGGISDNTLDASAFTLGSVILNGGAGNDTLTGGTGNDTLIGGSGIDTVKESGNVNFTLTNTTLTGLGTDTLNTIESANLTGGIGDNTLDASAFTLGSVFLDGGSGDDVLIGGTKNDTLIGGYGDDTLTGGLGNDSLDGGSGIDTVKESGNVNFTLTNTSLTGLGTDTLNTIESANLTSGIGNNTLNASAFTLGSVTLNGGAGNDTLTGGTGDDILIGGDGTDTVKESGNVNFTLTNTTLTGLGTDTLNTIESANLTGGIGDNTLDASAFTLGSVILNGGAGNDTLTGGFLNDSLFGGDGNDILNGVGSNNGVGSIDTLTGNAGNAGNDTFILGSSTLAFYNDGNDNNAGLGDYALIKDFSSTLDKIQLYGAANLYVLGTSPIGGVSGTAIYLDTNSNGAFSSTDELIAIVQGSGKLSLGSSYFSYV
ncbi:VCBS repeat-containing protein [Synechococcus sp. PCC 7502]|uniref:beta strand repeat-containing protein n=1 Tax=Synechococcus sp. PCC 7502 TaxID=1173263 RepID=UPI00029FC6F6|nr:VCBS domain-containing protein [Synechococcus sp. PCC 7502]AFY73019.1 VCBS repeat-containing protein [Synechococcus sp. PCC 7502]